MLDGGAEGSLFNTGREAPRSMGINAGAGPPSLSRGGPWRWSLSQRCSTLAFMPLLHGQGCNRGAGLLAGGQQFALELRGIGAARACHRVARGLRVFEHRVHVGFVDAILLRGMYRIKMGLQAAYD